MLKKNLRGKIPQLVCTYFTLHTLDTVDMSSPVFAAMSFRTIGLRSASSPSRKNLRCQSMMARMVLVSVALRCLMASM